MRPAIRFLAAALAPTLFACTALAAPGIHLNWDQCIGDGRVANKDFACSGNTGVENLVMSLESPVALTDRYALEMVVEIVSSDPVLPAWWDVKNAGSCRQTAIGILPTDPLVGACDNPFESEGVDAIVSYTKGTWGANNAELKAVVAVPNALAFSVGPGIETYAGHLIISHAKTTGTGACTGCNRPMCIGLGSIQVDGIDGSTNLILAGPSNPGGGLSSVTWQGAHVSDFAYVNGGNPQSPFFSMTCLASVPTAAQRSTWGGIKSLYR